MNKANRAAQFNAFDALKGLQEALKEKEEKLSRVERRELSEEQEEELSLCNVARGNIVEMTYYDDGRYVTVTDIVMEMNEVYRYIVLGKAKIDFDDVFDIKIV